MQSSFLRRCYVLIIISWTKVNLNIFNVNQRNSSLWKTYHKFTIYWCLTSFITSYSKVLIYKSCKTNQTRTSDHIKHFSNHFFKKVIQIRFASWIFDFCCNLFYFYRYHTIKIILRHRCFHRFIHIQIFATNQWPTSGKIKAMEKFFSPSCIRFRLSKDFQLQISAKCQRMRQNFVFHSSPVERRKIFREEWKWFEYRWARKKNVSWG